MFTRFILVISFFYSTLSFAQQAQTRSMSVGAGYKKQSFIDLKTGVEKLIDDTSWDLAFTVYGQQDAGVHINESAGLSMGQPVAGVIVYDAKTTDFSIVPDPTALTANELGNSEASWAYGAFNSGRSSTNPFDFGWGVYSPGSGSVVGNNKVFVVKLRSGAFKKLQIQSLTGNLYTFKYADLNGANERTATINKADYAGKTLAYFSLTTNTAINLEPATGFDLMYTRYVTTLYDPATMMDIKYQLTGVLSGRGVKVARASGVNQTAVNFNAYKDSLKTRLDIIGHDWKTFTGSGWVTPTDVVYYVQTANGNVYHMYFLDFEGSATGVAVYELRDLGIVSTIEANAPVSTLNVYPNPAHSEAQIVFDAKEAVDMQMQVIDLQGRIVLDQQLRVASGYQAERLDVSNFASGVYQLVLRSDAGVATTKLVVTQ